MSRIYGSGGIVIEVTGARGPSGAEIAQEAIDAANLATEQAEAAAIAANAAAGNAQPTSYKANASGAGVATFTFTGVAFTLEPIIILDGQQLAGPGLFGSDADFTWSSDIGANTSTVVVADASVVFADSAMIAQVGVAALIPYTTPDRVVGLGERNMAGGFVGIDVAGSSRVENDLRVGQPSFDGLGNFVEGAGRIRLGVSDAYPDGLLYLRQEGFPANYEEGSLAFYPVPANRWSGLSIAPSGDPWDLPTENVTSLALQLRNGASEERLTISSKWFGGFGGYGVYRIAPYRNGSGQFWDLQIGNNDAVQQIFARDGTVAFNNYKISDGSPAGNTVVDVVCNPIPDRMRLFARSSGEVGIESLTSGVSNWEMWFNGAFGGPVVRGVQPTLWLHETDAPANNRRWSIDASGGTMRILAVNDGSTSLTHAFAASRAGEVVTEVSLLGPVGSGVLRLQPNEIGFFGGNPATKPSISGSRGGNAALASLLSSLAGLGLITDGTSA
ncbi:hypothetical protein CP98_03648 [Sphingobium yanoikuyae]|uniref:Uncharacterized protein n=1 Tax=Sphingobium yanoikuyae TaxID=13690 RepID=A0A084EGQ8_SPHYA|nr:hypothetical protein [Sphingobium yanoikuyae]KEZ17150.1 hypothetical protein CP98_03648 [Sphingobium yanoikuyae]